MPTRDTAGTAATNTVVHTIQPPARHAQYQSWILFSDLHVKGASIETCEQVLGMIN